CNGSCCAGSCGKSSFCDFALGLCVYSINDECNPSIMCGVDAQCSSLPPDCPEECPDNCGYSSYCLGEKCYYNDTLVCNPIKGCFNDSTCVLGKCGNGKADAGEMCGEPGLSCPSNNFDCINCECICSSPEIICGNDCCLASECVNGVCVGGEECELPEVECGNDCCLASECVNGVCVGGEECELPNIVCEDGSCCSPDQCAIKNICIDDKCKPSLTKTCFPGCESDAECIIGSGKFWDNSCGWNTPGFLFNINNIEEISGEIFFDLNYICSKPNILSLELNNASSPKKNIFLRDNLSCNLNNNSIKIKSTNLEGLHEICFTLGNNMPCCVFKNIKLKQDINIPDNNLISLVLFFVLIVGIIFVQNKKLKK
ncbi:MAG TPA: hypothetical protein PKK60_00425, partial [archaeon]|nr:hypothetical protein [archaeon]